MKKEELEKIVSGMSLEEKALQLTQYPVYKLSGDAEVVVTGICGPDEADPR